MSSKNVLSLTQNERKHEIESNLEKILGLEKQIQDLKQRNNELTEICDKHDTDYIDESTQDWNVKLTANCHIFSYNKSSKS